jgi:Ca2+-binding EF-hand superfamily protein
LKDYFRFIDLQEKGYISARCFQDVLTENNIFCDEKDLKCLMKLFRKKVYERISLQEFIDFLDL